MTLAQAITQVRRLLASQHRRSIGNRQWPVNHRACAATLHQQTGRRFGSSASSASVRWSDNLVEGGADLARIRRTLVARV